MSTHLIYSYETFHAKYKVKINDINICILCQVHWHRVNMSQSLMIGRIINNSTYITHDQLDHGCTGIRLSRFRYISGAAGIAIMIQIWLLTFRQSLTCSGILHCTHYHIANLLERKVHVAISMWLSIGGVHLVRSVGIRWFHGQGHRGERGRGSGGNAARGRDVAALTVAMETEWWPRLWGDCLVDWTSIIDWICYHRIFAFVWGTPTCKE